MAKKVSTQKNILYLSILIAGYISLFIILTLAYTLDSSFIKSGGFMAIYIIFSIAIPAICWVCVFFPCIEIYSSKTYTKFSHINLALMITLFILTALIMSFTNPNFVVR